MDSNMEHIFSNEDRLFF